ncbi:N-ethylammeline chlorohydrolase [compost metagenome]
MLRSITLNAAEQLRLEAVVGSLEVGKFADLIVLDKNFMQAPEEELARNSVLLTLVGGKVVWAKAPFTGLAPTASTQVSISRSAQ